MNGIHEVRGSIPLVSTNLLKPVKLKGGPLIIDGPLFLSSAAARVAIRNKKVVDKLALDHA